MVYTGKMAKIAEHGGANPQDLTCRCSSRASRSGSTAGRTMDAGVETTQIAPTILKLLGLDPHALKAVHEEHTQALPLG